MKKKQYEAVFIMSKGTDKFAPIIIDNITFAPLFTSIRKAKKFISGQKNKEKLEAVKANIEFLR